MRQRQSDRRAQREWTRLAAFAASGLVCGVAAKLADGPVPQWLSDAANYPAAYVFALAAIARFAPTATFAASRAAAFFTSLCLAYYVWTEHVLGFGGGRYFFVWAALALTLVPGIAGIMWWANRRRGALPGLLVAGTAAVPLAEGPLRQLWLAYARGVEISLLHPVQASLDVLVAVLVAGILPRHTRTRVVALALSLPMYFVVNRAGELLRGFLAV